MHAREADERGEYQVGQEPMDHMSESWTALRSVMTREMGRLAMRLVPRSLTCQQHAMTLPRRPCTHLKRNGRERLAEGVRYRRVRNSIVIVCFIKIKHTVLPVGKAETFQPFHELSLIHI